MGKKRSTSQDVANAAGVSRTTVSLVLNNVQGVNIPEATRERVREAARRLGYVPNATAQALATQRARAIGLVMTRSPHHISSDVFLPQLISGLLTVIKKENFRLLIEIVDENADERAYVDLAQAKHIDGMIILTPRTTDKGIRKLEEMNIPAVLIGGLPESSLTSVHANDRSASREAVKHFIDLGHREIACVLNAPACYNDAQTRLAGYKDALEEAGLPYHDRLVRFADFDLERGQVAMESLLKSEKFTAAFIASDNVAMGANRAIREAGLHIPDDISIIGFDDTPWAAYADPPLTTVHIPAEEMATRSCMLLLDMIHGKKPAQQTYYLETELIIRESTKAIS